MTIFFNANVITLDPSRPRARTLVTGGERIIAVGDDSLRRSYHAQGTEEIDCQGMTLLPGFHDAHCHFISLASVLMNLDCSPRNVRCIADIRKLIAEKASTTPPGEWIVGESYDDFRLEEKRHPTRWDLDAVSPHHPARLNHRSRHACVLNSKALELAGITAESPDPPGGLIDRDPSTGNPTGLLFEMSRYLQKAPPQDEERLAAGIKLASDQYLSLGITSLQDAGAYNDLTRWRLFRQFKDNGLLASHVTMMVGRDALPDFVKTGLVTGSGDTNLRIGALKIVLDRSTGRLYPPQEELEETVLAAHRAGFQVAIHAIEEEDIEAAITAIEVASRQSAVGSQRSAVSRQPSALGGQWWAVRRSSSPRVAQASLPVGVGAARLSTTDYRLPTTPRHRIEHCSVCSDRLLERIKKAGAVVVTQPGFIYSGGDRYLATVPPAQRPYLYRLGSLVRAGVPVAAGSDTPVAVNDPLVGIYAAVTRRTRGRESRVRSQESEVRSQKSEAPHPGPDSDVIGARRGGSRTARTTGDWRLLPGEGLSPEQALALYASGAAFSALEESYKGTLTPGKLADMVLLDRDPVAIPAEDLKDIKVRMTILGGRAVWSAGH